MAKTRSLRQIKGQAMILNCINSSFSTNAQVFLYSVTLFESVANMPCSSAAHIIMCFYLTISLRAIASIYSAQTS